MVTLSSLQVTYGLTVVEGRLEPAGDLTLRNITINIGCTCSYFVPFLFNTQSEMLSEKK